MTEQSGALFRWKKVYFIYTLYHRDSFIIHEKCTTQVSKKNTMMKNLWDWAIYSSLHWFCKILFWRGGRANFLVGQPQISLASSISAPLIRFPCPIGCSVFCLLACVPCLPRCSAFCSLIYLPLCCLALPQSAMCHTEVAYAPGWKPLF